MTISLNNFFVRLLFPLSLFCKHYFWLKSCKDIITLFLAQKMSRLMPSGCNVTGQEMIWSVKCIQSYPTWTNFNKFIQLIGFKIFWHARANLALLGRTGRRKKSRSSHQKCSVKKGVLREFAREFLDGRRNPHERNNLTTENQQCLIQGKSCFQQFLSPVQKEFSVQSL